ncbi:oxidoreductase [Sulfobacillus acidophilus TPY]|uniref:Oxidoreductase domain protein n=1 Tax=Sulfobacillus acidophilus (strain ATCC 700253 / DSM 10332 / NAL) TaxID=679936 RepID=G8TWM6_SULAD|nr:oxidoreductase [Sulfobacillus acidophilus TPY]AEW06015.1 oxidoreductase domain protein [Sulfobacillus acidophilus DSM 10332]
MGIRLGIMGAARIAEQQVIPAARRTADFQVTAFASQTPASRKRWQDQFPELRAFSDYEALITADEVDALYIALPNALHVSWALRALAVGKPVLLEKPAALTAQDAEVLRERANQSGTVVMEAFMYQFHPQFQWLSRALRSGLIGSVRHLYAEFAFLLTHPKDIRMQPALGGGSFWDVGCYTVHITRQLLGAPQAVFARRIDGPTGVDIHMAVQLIYPDKTASLRAGFDSADVQGVRVVGTGGELGLTHPFRPDMGEAQQWHNQTVDVVPPADLYGLELRAFLAAIRDPGGLGQTYLNDLVEQARLMEAVIRASQAEALQSF